MSAVISIVSPEFFVPGIQETVAAGGAFMSTGNTSAVVAALAGSISDAARVASGDFSGTFMSRIAAALVDKAGSKLPDAVKGKVSDAITGKVPSSRCRVR